MARKDCRQRQEKMTLGRKIITLLIMSAFIIPLLLYADARGVQEGDIIFQTSLSSQSRAIQLATKSKYSHMGLILKEQGRFYVFEAVKNVKKTPLEEWIKRGEGGKYVIKRLKNADTFLDAKTLSKIKGEAEKFSGKEYDLTFEWSDEKMYCSELVWKIYKQSVDLEVG
ncbi:MAG: hypothetical protein LBT96_04175, partial [Campylobacteraceae bacterium]|nr:hypothetical protein [Campylobacteraceae bacterium]